MRLKIWLKTEPVATPLRGNVCGWARNLLASVLLAGAALSAFGAENGGHHNPFSGEQSSSEKLTESPGQYSVSGADCGYSNPQSAILHVPSWCAVDPSGPPPPPDEYRCVASQPNETEEAQRLEDACRDWGGTDVAIFYADIPYVWPGPSTPPPPPPPPPPPQDPPPGEAEMQEEVGRIGVTVESIITLNNSRRLENDVVVSVGDITVFVPRDPPFVLPRQNMNYLLYVDYLCRLGGISAELCGTVEFVLERLETNDVLVHVVDDILGSIFPESCSQDYVISNPYGADSADIRFFAPSEDSEGRCVLVELNIFEQVRIFNVGEDHSYNAVTHICRYQEGSCTADFVNQIRLANKHLQAPFIPPLTPVATDVFIPLCGYPPYDPFGSIVHEGEYECLGPLPTPNPIIFRVGTPTEAPPYPGLNSHCVTNRTRSPHIFHPGDVDRCLVADSEGVLMNTDGTGTGALPELNEAVGPILMKGLDYMLRAYYCRSPGVNCVN